MDLHSLKLKLQDHFKDGLVTIVGSGLSCAEGLPGMGELARYLDSSLTTTLIPPDLEKWKSISPLLPEIGLEAALLKTPPTPGLEAAIVARSAELIASHEKRIIAEVFSGRRTLRFTRLIRHLLKPESGLPVITTNYDRLVEIAVEDAGLGVDTLFVGSFAGELNEKESRYSFCRDVTFRDRRAHFRYRLRANVFKPHGSLDWYHRNAKPVRYAGDLDMPRLIITPGLNKFRNGYESPFDRHRERANAAIDLASRFFIIGYGFNDDHLETHLTPRICAGVPTLLLTRGISGNALRLATSCPNVTAIQHAEVEGINGSKVFISGTETFYPNLDLWDLGSFITQVLEP